MLVYSGPYMWCYYLAFPSLTAREDPVGVMSSDTIVHVSQLELEDPK